MKEYNAATRADNIEGLQAMIKYGIQEVIVSDDMLLQMKERTRPVWDEMAGILYPKELLDELVNNLEQFRSKSGTP